MFGLTRREQCWAAEQLAAELIAGVAKAALLAKTEIAKADANAGLSAALAKVEVLTKDRDDCLDARIHYAGIYGEAVGQRDQLAKLLSRCQETLDPHRDAVLWGDVHSALRSIEKEAE